MGLFDFFKKKNTANNNEYSLSVNVAKVMGHQISASFKGKSNSATEDKILKHFAFSDVLADIPEAFKMCRVFAGKLVDIHEATALMQADMEGRPSANVRVDSAGALSFQGAEGEVKNCQIAGKLSWAGGSCELIRTLFPASEKDKFYFVVVNSN